MGRGLSLFKPGNSIEEAEKMDQKLADTKKLYKENFDKFNKARQKKFALETKWDMIECTLRAVDSKVHALNSELHHLKLENERKLEGNRRSAENALLHSSGFQKLEQDIESMKERMMAANTRMNSLTMAVSNKETEIRSTRFNRMDMENTIKNILRKVKENVNRASLTSFSDLPYGHGEYDQEHSPQGEGERQPGLPHVVQRSPVWTWRIRSRTFSAR